MVFAWTKNKNGVYEYDYVMHHAAHVLFWCCSVDEH